jgi:hypothetical protein
MPSPLLLIIYDDTCRSRFGQGLSTIWSAGAKLYRARGAVSHVEGVRDWPQALRVLAETAADRTIDEIQFWGHGRWGRLFVGEQVLDSSAFAPGHALEPALAAVRERLSADARLWFRTCEAFGASRGHDFARAVTDYFGRPAAGHTYVIGFWQSGLHRLEPGHAPDWPAAEGLLEGSADAPRRAKVSAPGEPNTIHCFDGEFPPRKSA